MRLLRPSRGWISEGNVNHGFALVATFLSPFGAAGATTPLGEPAHRENPRLRFCRALVDDPVATLDG